MAKLRIFMAEDNAATRARLTQDLSDCADLAIVGSADTEVGALTWLVEHPHGWDLTIVDLASNPDSALRMLAACRVRRPNQRVAVLRSHATPAIWRRCKGMGADLVVDKVGDTASLLHYCAGLKAGGQRPGPRALLTRLDHFLRSQLAALVSGRGFPRSS
jgi:two-component system OmpR family response regulator